MKTDAEDILLLVPVVNHAKHTIIWFVLTTAAIVNQIIFISMACVYQCIRRAPEWECFQYQNINRHCYNGECVCDDGYYEDPYNGNKCSPIYATTRSVWTWLWIFIVLPIAFAIIIALYIRGIRMQSRNSGIVSGPQMVSVTQVYPVHQTNDYVAVHQV